MFRKIDVIIIVFFLILSIVLIERTFVTFEIDDDENSVVGIEDFSEYFNSILDELKKEIKLEK